ncbi:hypothetical protein DRE_06520 [Drechslerella stenobrocha 248]|uniref:Nuclear pore protein n=1 Tax=Drechslerella stenobrocha 248 TaxID=1043628 RepID=W7HXA3_9PEZI|nr:hypothetical protein DRE_06520 [Drechslerella stenobrocha 248]
MASQPPSETANFLGASILGDLLESSRKLRSDTKLPDLPSIQLGLGEIERRAKNLQGGDPSRSVDARAHYLLQAAGVNSEQTLKDLESVDFSFDETTTRPAVRDTQVDTDIDGFLRNRKEQSISKAIDEGIKRTTAEFEAHLLNNLNIDWDEQRKRIYEHFGLTKPSDGQASTPLGQSSFGVSAATRAGASTFGRSRFTQGSLGSLVLGVQPKVGNQTWAFEDTVKEHQGTPMDQMFNRQVHYARAVQKLNNDRTEGNPPKLIESFSEVTKLSSDLITTQLNDAWKMLHSIIGETGDSKCPKERQYARAYLKADYNSSEAVNLRQKIESGARGFLESSFFAQVEDTVAKFPDDAKVGGIPDPEFKVKGYINVKLGNSREKLKDFTFESINDWPGWAVVFYLLRCGRVTEAANFVQKHADQFAKLEKNFVHYITAYANSPDRRLQRNLLDRLHAEWNQRIKFRAEGMDPYKHACYKIIGRCELQKRVLSDVLPTAEDWMWLQLVLTRESAAGDEPAPEVYTNADLRKAIVGFGGPHFGLANSNFILYFQMLLMAGLFENAVQYLYSFLYADAVHFAIVLSYYGLLKAADETGASHTNLLTYTKSKSKQEEQEPRINFARLVGHYTQDFRKTNSEEAVDYLSLICLNGDIGGPAGDQQLKLCHEALRELVLETRDFARLLGDVRSDGSRERGAIQRRLKVLKLANEDEFLQTITHQAAAQADDDGRTSDAILLYHLGEDYDTVVSLVNRNLSDSLAVGETDDNWISSNPTVGLDAQGQPINQSISLTSVEDPAQLAKNINEVYSRNASIYGKVSKQNWEACGVLIRIDEAKKLYRANRFEECLQHIERLDVIPLLANAEIGAIRRRAQGFATLHETVSRTVPQLLVMSINCTNKLLMMLKSASFQDAAKEFKVNELNGKGRSALIYAGMIQYKDSLSRVHDFDFHGFKLAVQKAKPMESPTMMTPRRVPRKAKQPKLLQMGDENKL